MRKADKGEEALYWTTNNVVKINFVMLVLILSLTASVRLKTPPLSYCTKNGC